MKTRWILGTLLTFAGSCFAVALAGGGANKGGPNFDHLSDADRATLENRFVKEIWPLMERGGKQGCVGCHNAKVVSSLKMTGKASQDFRKMLRDGFFVPNDSGSLLTRIQSTNRKQKMPPPGRGEPWTAGEKKILDAFVKDLDKKQQK